MNVFVGGRYLSHNGFSVRAIEELRGDDVYWRDNVGPGRCSKATFNKWAASLASDSPPAPLITLPPKQISKEVVAKVKEEIPAIQKLSALISNTKTMERSLRSTSVSKH